MTTHEAIDSAMSRALVIAQRSPAFDANPQVGCVIVAPDGRIVAEGWHQGSGTPHAEVDALAQLPAAWRERAAELTAVVTLEPCNHVGQTGPCSHALADFGIGCVVFGTADEGAHSRGGADYLREHGVRVSGGVRGSEADALISPWLTRQTAPEHGTTSTATPARPFIVAKWAQTLDGRAAAADGSSQWITGENARADVHRRRAEADAVLVGTGTLIADNPRLTARDEHGELLVDAARQPIPVVLGRRDIPAGAHILHHPALAARELTGPIRLTGAHLAADLQQLADLGIDRVFVEGGPTVTSALIAAGFVDELLIYVAPALLGGPQLALGELAIGNISDILRLHVVSRTELGEDTLIRATLSSPTHHRKEQH